MLAMFLFIRLIKCLCICNTYHYAFHMIRRTVDVVEYFIIVWVLYHRHILIIYLFISHSEQAM